MSPKEAREERAERAKRASKHMPIVRLSREETEIIYRIKQLQGQQDEVSYKIDVLEEEINQIGLSIVLETEKLMETVGPKLTPMVQYTTVESGQEAKETAEAKKGESKND